MPGRGRRRRAWRKEPIPAALLLSRVPGAAFFFVLLALHPDGALLAYALAFAPPYLVALSRGARVAMATRARSV